VRVFGHSVRDLWLAANWFKFPRAAPGAGMVAVRRHHVFVLEVHLGGDTWLALRRQFRRSRYPAAPALDRGLRHREPALISFGLRPVPRLPGMFLTGNY
jgi:hypothetical protein